MTSKRIEEARSRESESRRALRRAESRAEQRLERAEERLEQVGEKASRTRPYEKR